MRVVRRSIRVHNRLGRSRGSNVKLGRKGEVNTTLAAVATDLVFFGRDDAELCGISDGRFFFGILNGGFDTNVSGVSGFEGEVLFNVARTDTDEALGTNEDTTGVEGGVTAVGAFFVADLVVVARDFETCFVKSVRADITFGEMFHGFFLFKEYFLVVGELVCQINKRQKKKKRNKHLSR